MPDAERDIWINNNLNVGQVRDASCELMYSTTQVLEPLVELVYEVNPNLGPTEGTMAVKDVFKKENIPIDRRQRWNQDEMRVYRFLTSISTKNTPARMDYKIQRARRLVDLYGSPRDAYEVWQDTLLGLNRRLVALQKGRISSLHGIDRAYVESRVLRFALMGHYLVSPETLLFIAN